MRDLVIKAPVIKRELWVLLASVILAFLLNIYSIVAFNTEWSELYTQLHVTLLFGIGIYIIIGLIRLIIAGIISLTNTRKKNT